MHVRILVELKTSKGALLSNTLQRSVLESMMPREFWGLVHFWSEDMVRSLFPAIAPLVVDS
jgi:hypothetical protein